MPDYKMMPHNLDAEQATLGCLLIDSMCQTEIMSMLKSDDFYTDAHRNIFAAMVKIFQKNTPLDFVTHTEDIEREGTIDAIGGIDYINFLSNVVPSAANYKFYVDIVKSNSVRRMLIKSGQNIIEKAYSNEDKEEVLSFSEAEIYSISEKEEISQLEHIGKPNGAIKAVIDKFDKVAKDPNSLRGLPTGYRDIDNITNGLQNSDLILLAARPSVGKTSFAMNLVTNIAVKEGKSCAVFSLEMSKDQLMQRMLCSEAEIDSQRVKTGNMQSKDWEKLATAMNAFAQAPIYIDDTSGCTITDIRAKCRRLKMEEKNLGLVLIDYLQLMESAGREDRMQQISAISRGLKILAKELDVPVLALSQLSRAVESRTDKRPMLSDLRESGSIEQDADIVMFIYRDEYYRKAEDGEEDIAAKAASKGESEVIIAKHRNGSVGTVKLLFQGNITKFKNPIKTDVF